MRPEVTATGVTGGHNHHYHDHRCCLRYYHAAPAANAICYFHAKAAVTADTAPRPPPPQGRRRGLPPAGQAPRPDTRSPAELSPRGSEGRPWVVSHPQSPSLRPPGERHPRIFSNHHCKGMTRGQYSVGDWGVRQHGGGALLGASLGDSGVRRNE